MTAGLATLDVIRRKLIKNAATQGLPQEKLQELQGSTLIGDPHGIGLMQGQSWSGTGRQRTSSRRNRPHLRNYENRGIIIGKTDATECPAFQPPLAITEM